MPDLSGTMRKCRIGTAKNFTLLLLLYITQPNGLVMSHSCRGQLDASVPVFIFEMMSERKLSAFPDLRSFF